MDEEHINTELTKILAKIMQSSYKKSEINEMVEGIMKRVEKIATSTYDLGEIKSLRMEFEEIRREFYGLK